MQVSLVEAATHLSELAAHADAGEEVVLTRGNHPPLLLVAQHRRPTREEKLAALDDLENAGARATPGPDAAHCADFLYDDYGLPA
ncbi:type II toxin-antitoxin system Phd/YefM family antitoxin [uncultured Sphingomonas sp.]|uniref:type II toxin-antitoxin system Phd/YefM family antitoxin n=1 Tax=uncultured Sphingomonas sp. TaxID=158754 RepID=UPI0035CA4174